MRIKLGLAQIAPVLGNFDKNYQIHEQWIEQAKSQKVDLLVFPELGLTGYYLKDIVPELALSSPYQKIQELSKKAGSMDLVTGFVEKSESQFHYIAASYASAQKIVHTHRKCYLPTYGIFDDQRFFGAGTQAQVFDTRFGKIGILICEDAWHYPMAYLLALQGAQIIINVSCSPGTGAQNEKLLSQQKWETLNAAYAHLFGVFMVYVNRVGVEDGIQFWGGSHVFAPGGELVAAAKTLEPELKTVEIDLNALSRNRQVLPLLRDEKIDWTIAQLESLKKSRP